MITGFNTDIDFEGVTYHVQTEDKGLATPLILSLVYNRGTILASKRSPYDDLLADFDEKVLTERLQKQHKLICAAIRAGRLEDLKRMTIKESALRQKGLIAQKEVKSVVEKKEEPKPENIEAPTPAILQEKLSPTAQPLNNQIAFDDKQGNSGEAVWDIPLKILDESAIEIVEVVGEEAILPAEAVEIISDLAKGEKPDNKLRIEILDKTSFRGGERKAINLMVRRGKRKIGLSGAQILVKIIGTSFRPLIFHAKTDTSGKATVHLQLPNFVSGRAAVIARAISEGEEVEIRRAIRAR